MQSTVDRWPPTPLTPRITVSTLGCAWYLMWVWLCQVTYETYHITASPRKRLPSPHPTLKCPTTCLPMMHPLHISYTHVSARNEECWRNTTFSLPWTGLGWLDWLKNTAEMKEGSWNSITRKQGEGLYHGPYGRRPQALSPLQYQTSFTKHKFKDKINRIPNKQVQNMKPHIMHFWAA